MKNLGLTTHTSKYYRMTIKILQNGNQHLLKQIPCHGSPFSWELFGFFSAAQCLTASCFHLQVSV